MHEKRGQVWVETVIYILIALAMIGAVLAFARPKIQEIQDKIIIDQTIEILRVIDEQIYSAVNGGSGNIRIIDLDIKRGEVNINQDTDKIIYLLEDSNSQYSEPTKEIEIGDVKVLTEQSGKKNKITLTLDYFDKYDIQYDGSILTKSPTPYKISIKNDGNNEDGTAKIIIKNI